MPVYVVPASAVVIVPSVVVTVSSEFGAAPVIAYAVEVVPFAFTVPGSAVPLAWVGLENKVDVTWVYVEAKGVDATAGLSVRDALFQDLFSEQVNMLHVNDARGRRALDFRSGDGFKPF